MSFKPLNKLSPSATQTKNPQENLIDAIRKAVKNGVDLGEALNDVFSDKEANPAEAPNAHQEMVYAFREGMTYGASIPSAYKKALELDMSQAVAQIRDAGNQEMRDAAMSHVSFFGPSKKANAEIAAIAQKTKMQMSSEMAKINKAYSLDKFKGESLKMKKAKDDKPNEALTAASLRKMYRGY